VRARKNPAGERRRDKATHGNRRSYPDRHRIVNRRNGRLCIDRPWPPGRASNCGTR
jgi:hypothetical protein